MRGSDQPTDKGRIAQLAEAYQNIRFGGTTYALVDWWQALSIQDRTLVGTWDIRLPSMLDQLTEDIRWMPVSYDTNSVEGSECAA